jgi:hypothetical protein
LLSTIYIQYKHWWYCICSILLLLCQILTQNHLTLQTKSLTKWLNKMYKKPQQGPKQHHQSAVKITQVNYLQKLLLKHYPKQFPLKLLTTPKKHHQKQLPRQQKTINQAYNTHSGYCC